MFLLNNLNLLLVGRGDGDSRRYEGRPSEAATAGAFPAGELTSTAWAGWWHEDAA